MKLTIMRLEDAEGQAVVERLEIASDSRARMVGLLGRSSMAPQVGLYLAPCSAIHTFGMRFAIDLIFVDQSWRVVSVEQDVGPFRMAWGGWQAHGVVEVASGWLSAERVPLGATLHLRELPPPDPAGPVAEAAVRL